MSTLLLNYKYVIQQQIDHYFNRMLNQSTTAKVTRTGSNNSRAAIELIRCQLV